LARGFSETESSTSPVALSCAADGKQSIATANNSSNLAIALL